MNKPKQDDPRVVARKRLPGLSCLLLAALLLVPGPVLGQQTVAWNPSVASYQPLYDAAVADAKAVLTRLKDPPPNPDIWDINADNASLIWMGEAGKSPVLMVAYTKASYYSSSVGQTISAAVDLWLTPAPEVKQELAAKDPYGVATAPALSLSQYLGLPPGNANDSVVELWVGPASLIRPAMDPAIDNHVAEREFFLSGQNSPATEPAVLPGSSPAGTLPVATGYTQWFSARESAIFNPDTAGGAYPWTGLGYTYNWGAADHVGASEFLAPKGSLVTVKSVTPVGAYFH